jgi:shikimate dehydrogenase
MSIIHYVNGKTKLLGVIGRPLSHSISPKLHNTLSDYLGIDAVYVPLAVDEGNLKNAVNGLKALNFAGFNITIPYKSDMVLYVDEISEEAGLIGAVNTVKIINNKLYGYNTDVFGFVNSFKEEAKTDFKNKKVVMIGAGGAAKAIALGVACDGASKIIILNRSLNNAAQIAEIISSNISPYKEYPQCIECYELNDNEAIEILKQADIVINTTPLGMYPDVNRMPLTNGMEFSSNQIIYDVIYNPKKTRFMDQAEKKGCKIINGLGMLIYQGIKAYEIWMDLVVPDEIVKKIFSEFQKYLSKKVL